jgi:mRNA-degrading endonuclease RelE of RelBE toxin-antitoxin system
MNKFQVNLTEHATDDLKDISKEFRDKIHQDLKALESAPFPSGTHIKRLRGFRPPVYRLRSGGFRVLYHIQGNTVTILRVIDRKLLERVLKSLKASLRQ